MGKIPGPKKNEETKTVIITLTRSFINLYSSHNDCFKRDERVVNVEGMGEMKITYQILVEKTQGKRPLGGPRCRWKGY
jgi:hypothetical protein